MILRGQIEMIQVREQGSSRVFSDINTDQLWAQNSYTEILVRTYAPYLRLSGSLAPTTIGLQTAGDHSASNLVNDHD